MENTGHSSEQYAAMSERYAAVAAENERLKALNAAMAAQGAKLSLKVSSKGGLSVYGLNSKWPVTLYLGQWERLFAFVDTMREFIATHRDEFTSKAA